MKFLNQVALAFLVSFVMVFAPASAYASKSSHQPRTVSYHDRTPHVHIHTPRSR